MSAAKTGSKFIKHRHDENCCNVSIVMTPSNLYQCYVHKNRVILNKLAYDAVPMASLYMTIQ